jgi:hypothetical protein
MEKLLTAIHVERKVKTHKKLSNFISQTVREKRRQRFKKQDEWRGDTEKRSCRNTKFQEVFFK